MKLQILFRTFISCLLGTAFNFSDISIAQSANISKGQAIVTITTKGKWEYRDKNFVNHAIADARVEIWEVSSSLPLGEQFLGFTHTITDGSYQMIVDTDTVGLIKIYAKVLARDDISVRVVTTLPIIGERTYASLTPSNSVTTSGTLDFGTHSITGTNRAVFYIYDLIANTAYDFMNSKTGWRNTYNLEVQWSSNSIDGSYYNLGEAIHFKGSDQWDSDVLLHEFGHFVMDKIYPSYPPFPNCSPHTWNVNSSEGCAWTEGWATFLQAAIRNDGVYEDIEPTSTIHFELEPPSPSANSAQQEGAVASSLWDISDSRNEPWDNLSNGLNGSSSNGIWHVIQSQSPPTVNLFECFWFVSNNGFNNEVINIFSHQGINNTQKSCLTYLPLIIK